MIAKLCVEFTDTGKLNRAKFIDSFRIVLLRNEFTIDKSINEE